MTFSLDDFSFGQTLGSGSTGIVVSARNNFTSKNYAIKIVEKGNFESDPRLITTVKKEISIMKLFHHPNILQLEHIIEKDDKIYIIEQLANKGSLYDIILKLNTSQAMEFFRQLTFGLETIHNVKICHRDLKPENLLLSDSNQILIADFGIAAFTRTGIISASSGSPHYQSPEQFLNNSYDGFKADIWSLGVILYSMITKEHPFAANSINETISLIERGIYKKPIGPPDIVDLIEHILVRNPDERYSLNDIKAHPAFCSSYPSQYILPKPMLPNDFEISIESFKEPIFSELKSICGAVDKAPSLWSKDISFIYLLLENDISLPNLPWFSSIHPAHPFVYPIDDDANFGSSNSQVRVTRQYKNIRGVRLSPVILVTHVQQFLIKSGFEWFHPDPESIFARSPNGLFYMTIKINVDLESAASWISITVDDASPQNFAKFCGDLIDLLRDYLEKNSDDQLTDINLIPRNWSEGALELEGIR